MLDGLDRNAIFNKITAMTYSEWMTRIEVIIKTRRTQDILQTFPKMIKIDTSWILKYKKLFMPIFPLWSNLQVPSYQTIWAIIQVGYQPSRFWLVTWTWNFNLLREHAATVHLRGPEHKHNFLFIYCNMHIIYLYCMFTGCQLTNSEQTKICCTKKCLI